MQTRQPYRHSQVLAARPEERHRSPGQGPLPDRTPPAAAVEVGEAGGIVEEFVRFCRRRRRVGWPELYDEMCAVAGRGIFRGWGMVELAEHGIGFTLADMPHLAAIVGAVVQAERASAAGGLPRTLAAEPQAGSLSEGARGSVTGSAPAPDQGGSPTSISARPGAAMAMSGTGPTGSSGSPSTLDLRAAAG